MELSIIELFLNASLVVKTVIIILILASIVSWMIIFERWLYIKKISQELLDFEIRFWSDAGLQALLSSSQQEGHNPVGAEYIFQIGYLDYKRLSKESLGPDIVMDSVQRNMRVALAKEQSLLEKHGVTESSILNGKQSSNFENAARELADRAWAHYKLSSEAIPKVNSRDLLVLEAMATIYWNLLQKMQNIN